jgi:hypothetical protein
LATAHWTVVLNDLLAEQVPANAHYDDSEYSRSPYFEKSGHFVVQVQNQALGERSLVAFAAFS